MTNILTKVVNRVMSLWGGEPMPVENKTSVLFMSPPNNPLNLTLGDKTYLDCKLISIRIGDEELQTTWNATYEFEATNPFIGDEPLSGMDMHPQAVIISGTYLTRSGQRVEYLDTGEGRFLPYGLRTGGWDTVTGRWLSSGEDHAWDLVERVEDND